MLQIKLTSTGLSADGTSIPLRDTTGAYDATNNPGGYGAPNPTLSAAIVAILRYYVYGNKPTDIVVDKNDMAAGKIFTPYNLGVTGDAATPYLIPDGVNAFEYLLGYAVAGGISVTGKVVTVTGLTLPANLKYISFSSDNITVYEVESQSDTTLVLKHTPVYIGGDTLVAFYSGTLDVLVDTYIQKLIDKKVIALKGEPCVEAIELYEDVLNLFGASARFEAKDYLGASTLITTLNRRYTYADR